MSSEIIEAPPLLTKGITDKQTLATARREFVCGARDCRCITETSENPKMSVSRRFIEETFIGCFTFENRGGGAVYEIASNECAFPPKLNRKLGLKHESASHIEDMAMFTLDTTILLRCGDTGGLKEYAMIGKVGAKGKKLRPVITANTLYCFVKLGNCEAAKLL